jgi:hypothetical protein
MTDIGPMAKRKDGHVNSATPITMFNDGHMTHTSLAKEYLAPGACTIKLLTAVIYGFS